MSMLKNSAVHSIETGCSIDDIVVSSRGFIICDKDKRGLKELSLDGSVKFSKSCFRQHDVPFKIKHSKIDDCFYVLTLSNKRGYSGQQLWRYSSFIGEAEPLHLPSECKNSEDIAVRANGDIFVAYRGGFCIFSSFENKWKNIRCSKILAAPSFSEILQETLILSYMLEISAYDFDGNQLWRLRNFDILGMVASKDVVYVAMRNPTKICQISCQVSRYFTA